MKVLTNVAVLGLLPVPPLHAGEDGGGRAEEHNGNTLRSARPGPEGSARLGYSRRCTWRWVKRRLRLALSGLSMIAFAGGSTAASSYFALEGSGPPALRASTAPIDAALAGWGNGKPLRPITFGMLPSPTKRLAMTLLPHPNNGRAGPAMSPTGVVIDVIVAYTRKAALSYGDIERDLVALAIEEANQSFRVSNLGHIKLRLVHAYRTAYLEEGTHFDHVWRFADKNDGYMDEIHGLRDQYRADVAILVVDDAKGCGLATRVQADADDAFAVVHHACAAASFTLAHEIGHLIGARHELGYVSGTKWRDIMSYKDACGGCPRVAVWSNPAVLVNGEPAGTRQLNNARIIAEEAARVAAFR
jgi:hypothetical protein